MNPVEYKLARRDRIRQIRSNDPGTATRLTPASSPPPSAPRTRRI
ncbi:DUF6408 family protein [Streptomyces sp. MnatMP-M17]